MSDEPEVIAKLRYLHAATVDWLTTECATTGVTISPILAAYDAIVAERDAAIAECHEQARLNGMGSEREARIMAERDALTARLAACERDLLAWRVWGDKAASGHPDAPMASLDHEVRAVIGNKYGMYTITDVSSETQEGA